MATPFSVPIDAFLKRVEKDRDFFSYFGVSEEAAMALAEQRANNYLHEAVGRLYLECSPAVDFSDIDEDAKTFNFDWTLGEVLLISSLMYEYYLDRDIAYLKLQNVNYTATDLRVLDPSNARKTFMEMYNAVCAANEKRLDDYRSRDRLTGKLIGIDYDVHNADGE